MIVFSPILYQSLKQISVPDGRGSFVCDMGVDAGRRSPAAACGRGREAGDERHGVGPKPGRIRPWRPQPLQREHHAGSPALSQANRERF